MNGTVSENCPPNCVLPRKNVLNTSVNGRLISLVCNEAEPEKRKTPRAISRVDEYPVMIRSKPFAVRTARTLVITGAARGIRTVVASAHEHWTSWDPTLNDGVMVIVPAVVPVWNIRFGVEN